MRRGGRGAQKYAIIPISASEKDIPAGELQRLCPAFLRWHGFCNTESSEISKNKAALPDPERESKGGQTMGKMALLWYASWIISLIWILYVIKTGKQHHQDKEG